MKITKLIAVFLILSVGALAADPISPKEAAHYIGESAEVCGVVASATYAAGSRGRPTFLNLDQPYPDHIFTAVIWGSDRSNFSYAPESLRGERICVIGTITVYRDKPQIKVTHPSQIRR